jgi:hypothetical protein
MVSNILDIPLTIKKIKVKFTLKQAMKPQRRSRGKPIALLFP